MHQKSKILLNVNNMNYNILFTLFLSSVMSVSSLAQSTNEVPFSKGVNLTEWFQAGSASQIDFSKFTFEDVKDIKSLGVDVIDFRSIFMR